MLIGCVLLLDALVGERGVVEMVRTRQEAQTLQQALTRIQRQNQRLIEEARRLETDVAVEDLARRELGLIKPGERVFTVRDIEPEAVSPSDPSAPGGTAD